MRCLIIKEILDLKHAKFLLGDFIPWLEDPPTEYDLTFASSITCRTLFACSN
jgi:hypothetical protein